MNEEEQNIFIRTQRELEAMQTERTANQTENVQRELALQEENKTMITEQLDLSEEKRKIEMLLRGKILTRVNGSEVWAEPPTDEFKPLNDYGVHLIMKIVEFYINKNKLLSNYSEELINTKMYDLGIDLADMIFMKYREMGLDTEEKRKLFSMIVREVLDSIHDTYLRALKGMERNSLRRHMHISENNSAIPTPPQKQGGIFSWVK